MSDSEEDYMSDKLLMSCKKDDIRPGLLFNKRQKRQDKINKKQEEHNQKKSYHEQEKEARDRGLGTAISSNNKGFRLLEKMGYKSGTGLGKSFSGITEPIAIKTNDGTSGVGREKHITEIIQKKTNLKVNTLKAKEEEFKSSRAQHRALVMVQKDYMKAQRICEELDFQNGVEVPESPCFWPKQARDTLKKNSNVENKDETENSGKDVEEQVEEITEGALCDLIMYLRRKYNYCMYCGDYIPENDNAFLSCPGYFRKYHDE